MPDKYLYLIEEPIVQGPEAVVSISVVQDSVVLDSSVESFVVPVVSHQSVESVEVDPVPPPPSAFTSPVNAKGVAATMAAATDFFTKFLRCMIFVGCDFSLVLQGIGGTMYKNIAQVTN